MRTIFLICDKPVDVDLLADDLSCLGAVSISRNQLVVEGSSGRLYVRAGDDISNEYEDSQLNLIKCKIVNPTFVEFSSNNPSLIDSAIMQIHRFGGSLLDNDHGIITTIEDVKKKIVDGIEWQTTT